MSTSLLFSDFLKRRGLPLKEARLVRHNQEIANEYFAGRNYFEHAVTYQAAALNPYNKAHVAYHFLPGPVLDDGGQTALFVGAHHIGETWPFAAGERLAAMHCNHERCYKPLPKDRAFELSRLSELDDLIDRLLIRWGPPSAARAWSQWAEHNQKEIVELSLRANEADFPGFSRLTCSLNEIATMPRSWRTALSAVSGVYLLVCPNTGQQYVGSAYGEFGFWGRWANYAATGHGGNKRLIELGSTNFRMSILEILPTETPPDLVIARENAWKEKLGSRAHGLNAN